MTFNRLKVLCSHAASVADAVSESDIVELDADKSAVKRRHALPGDLNLVDHSIVTKPYPADVSFEQISEFWAKSVGPVAATRLRRDASHQFKGSAFVEFVTADDAKLAVEKAASAEGLEFAGQKLTAELKAAYLQRKALEHANDPKQKRSAGKKAAAAAAAAATATGTAAASSTSDGAASATAAVAAAPPKEDELHYTPGCIIKIDGLGLIPDRDDLKQAFAPFGEVEYVDYTDSATHGFIRFSDPDAAQAALDAFAAGKREVFNKTPVLSLVEGDAERDYWRAIVDHGKARAQRGGRGGRGGRGRGRGGGRGGGGRGQKRRRD